MPLTTNIRAACLVGFAWAGGAYFSGGQSPFYAIKSPPTRTVVAQDGVERTEMLRAAQEMAEDIRALKANVEALRAAQSRSEKDATALRRPEDASQCGEDRNRRLDRRPSGQGRANARRARFSNYRAAQSH